VPRGVADQVVHDVLQQQRFLQQRIDQRLVALDRPVLRALQPGADVAQRRA